MTQGPGANLIPLKQLSLSEIISGSLNSLRRMPKTLLGIGLFSGFIVGISSIIASALVVQSGESLEIPALPNPASTINQEQIEQLVAALGPTLKVGVITVIVLFFVQAISAGMFTHVIGNAIIGKKIQANESWRKTRPQIIRIILLSFLSILFPVIAILVGLAVGIGLTGISSSFVFVGLGIGFVAALYLWIGFYVIIPVVVLEDASLRTSIKRSFFLIRGNVARVFGIGLMGLITSQALSIVVSAPFALLGQTNESQDQSTSTIFMSSMGSIIGYTVMLPFMATFATLLYTDLRIRKENIVNELNKAANQ